MDIHKLKQRKEQLQCEVNRLQKLIVDYEACERAIETIGIIRQHAGTMLFVGKSGKIDDEIELGGVRINDVGGCVAIPELLLELASKKLSMLESEGTQLKRHTCDVVRSLPSDKERFDRWERKYTEYEFTSLTPKEEAIAWDAFTGGMLSERSNDA